MSDPMQNNKELHDTWHLLSKKIGDRDKLNEEIKNLLTKIYQLQEEIKMEVSDAFPLPLRGEFIGRGRWKLTEPFKYVNPPVDFEIPIGFVTDGASIPWLARLLIGSPWGGKYAKAAVPHDYRYYIQTIPRRKADKQFIDGMTILGVPGWKKRLMYRAVRLGGWISWGRRRRKLVRI